MPPWSSSVDGVIAIRAPEPAASQRIAHADQDACLMATLTRLSRAPVVHPPPPTDHRATDAVVTADLAHLAKQLHAETRTLRRLLCHKKGEPPSGNLSC